MQTIASRSRQSMAVRGSRHSPGLEHKRKSISGYDTQGDAGSFALPPWPEWSDLELNTERWESPSYINAQKIADKQKIAGTISGVLLLGFQDPMGHAPLPCSLQADNWIRLSTIPGYIVVDQTAPDVQLLDLVTPNTHLLHSEVMRWILSGIMSLYQIQRRGNLDLEGEGSAFALPPGQWKPWNHVYANCKVIKGAPHKPLPNGYGKYIVRLFYMGCWRRITVDDYLPLDSNNQPLLPMTDNPKEIWPALLAKALLKVASLSWNEEAEVRDFSVIGCLTGWHAQVLSLHEVPSRTIWWLCQKLLMSDAEDPEIRFTGVKDHVLSEAYETGSYYSQSPLTHSATIGSDLTDPSAEVLGSVILCGVLDTKDTTEQFSEHPVLLTEARIFVHGDEDRPPTPLWKTFRWKKWAIEQGIILDESVKFMKGIRIFSPLYKVESNANSMLAEAVKSTFQPKKTEEIKDEPTKNGKKQKKKEPKKSDKEPMKSEVKTKGEEVKEDTNYEDTIYPEYWIEFDNLVRRIKSFEIYYRTTSFVHNLKVTDVSQVIDLSQFVEKPSASPITSKASKKASMKDVRVASSASMLGTSLKKKVPPMLYLLMDSVQCKKLVVTVSVLRPGITLPLKPLITSDTEINSSAGSIKEDTIKEDTAPTYHIMIEEYDWQTHTVGTIIYTLKAVGTNTELLRLHEGLKVLRVWIKLPDVFCVRISSQTPFTLGTRDKIQGILSGESASWLYYGSNFSSAFNVLTKIELGGAEHKEMLENLCRSYLPMYIPKHFSKYMTKIRRKLHNKFENTLVALLLEKTEDVDTVVNVILEWRWMFMRNNFGYRPLTYTPAGDILAQLTRGPSLSGKNMTPLGSCGSYLNLGNTMRETVLPEDVVSPANSLSTYRLVGIDQRSTVITFDQQSGVEFLRRMIGSEQDFLKFYPFRNDDKHLIQFVDYSGTIHSSNRSWLPLVRMIVNTHSDQNPFCTISLITTVTNGVLEVVNNDTLEVFPNFLDEIEPTYIPTNRHGYTILGFGTVSENSRPKDYHWKIRIGSVFQENLPHACSMKTTGVCSPEQPPPLTVLEVKDHYIPNKDHIIFKCLLTVGKTQPITIRSLTSNKNVEYVLRIRDNDEQIVKEYSAIGEKVIPIIRFIGKDAGGPEFFIIEAEVLRETWSLSSEEKITVNNLRDKGRQALLVFGQEEEERQQSVRLSSTLSSIVNKIKKSVVNLGSPEISSSSSDLVPGAPFWSLIVVVDEEFSSTVTLERDRRVEERIRQIKAQWEEAEPGRYKKSSQVRQEFLQRKLYCKDEEFNEVESIEDQPSHTELTDKLIDMNSVRKSETIINFDEDFKNEQLDQQREVLKQFEEDYENIRMGFDNICSRQFSRHQKLFKHLEDVRLKSREMIDNAYNERNNCVAKLTEKIEAEKMEAEKEAKAAKAAKSAKGDKTSKKGGRAGSKK